jgi:predicted phosphoribosyltransferase
MNIYSEQTLFKDRTDAGKRLAKALIDYRGKDTVVFAIPRGGVPVALEVAAELKTDLDIVIVSKIQVPSQPEAGYGAVTEDGTLVLNEPMVKRLNMEREDVERQADAVREKIMRRSLLYRRKISPRPVKDKIAIIIDDGLASGYTMLAAVQSLRKRKASEIVVAVPVSSRSAYNVVKPEVNELISLIVDRSNWFAVASYYLNWHDLNDEEVGRCFEFWRTRMVA